MNAVITDDEIRERVSNNLHWLLPSLGMSRYRLAKITGESDQTIKNVYDGTHVAKSGLLARIAEAIGLKMDDLIDDRLQARQSGAKINLRKSSRKLESVA